MYAKYTAKHYTNAETLEKVKEIIPGRICKIRDATRQILELKKWFREDLFTWCNNPTCSTCDTAEHQKYDHVSPSTEEELKFDASRAEVYKCGKCDSLTRFARYNDPLKLCETKTGRCSEWSNTFTTMCIALGHEARKVHDWTDHVWTEVWLSKTKKWVHVDACEPKGFDTPLMYEQGWGKKLSYCIAFSPDEIIDVSKNYVVS